MVKPDFDRFSRGSLSVRAALDEICGNSGAMSSKNNLFNFCCDPKNDSLHNYAVFYTTGSTVDHACPLRLEEFTHLAAILSTYTLGQLVPK